MENAPLMVRFLSRWLGDRQMAEEQTQEAFEVLLDRWDELGNHPNLSGWLWKTMERLPRDKWSEGRGEPELEKLVIELQQTQERDFRLEMVVARVDGPRFDAVKRLGALHWRHAAFFDEHLPTDRKAAEIPPAETPPAFTPEEPEETVAPDVEDAADHKVPERHKRTMHPRWARMGARILAAALVLAAVAAGVFNLVTGWENSHWEKVDGLMVGKFESFAQALTVNGVAIPMAPTLIPEPGEYFGALTLKCAAQRFVGYDLFTAQYRDEDGKGYSVKITRPDYPTVINPAGASVAGAKEYVCDGIAYYVIPNGTGTYHVSWGRAGLSGYIDGDLDQDTAMALARSITRTPEGRIPGTPERSPVLVYDSLTKLLAANRLDTKLAPTWLPEDMDTVDRFVTGAGHDTDVTMVHSEYRGTADRMLALQLEWWEDPARPSAPAFQWEGSAYRTEVRGGVEYTLLSDGYAQVIAWRKGHFSAWLYGTLGEDELWKIIDSIPQWDAQRPATAQADASDEGVQVWPTLSRAVESLGLDTNLVPTWLPDGFRVREVESQQTADTLKIEAIYRKDDMVMSMGFVRYDSEAAAERSTAGKNTMVPVEIYEHNGFTYYIVGYGNYWTVNWRNGMLEGYISGPFVESQVRKIINSIPAEV